MTCGERSVSATTRSMKSGPGQVEARGRERLAGVVEEAGGVLAEELLDPAGRQLGYCGHVTSLLGFVGPVFSGPESTRDRPRGPVGFAIHTRG